jgi:hypothetical protein
MSATLDSNHDAEARALLLTQYRGMPGIVGILDTYAGDVQDLENAFWTLRTMMDIFDATGVQLDGLGTLLNSPRNGISDDAYRGVLLAKSAQNVSQGTPEDVIKVFKLLMDASYVEYLETPDAFPASFQITASGATPVTSTTNIKNAINATRAAGVIVSFFASSPGVTFSFLGDPDPTGQGFADLNNLSVGGYFSSIF